MAVVKHPLYISSRLMAALDIPGLGTCHVHAKVRTDEGRVRYSYLVEDEARNEVITGEDIESGVNADVDYTDAMGTLLSFMSHAAENYRYHFVDSHGGGDGPVFGTAQDEWCFQHEDEIAMAQCDLEDR